ncbi:MAG: PAS domain-containing protein, partial [Anaerolineae bacterium]|nr:PAS domain-containing protein [Anaerolineae bacterium]
GGLGDFTHPGWQLLYWVLTEPAGMARFAPGWQNSGVLEAAFDQLSDAILLYDRNYVITGANAAAEKLFGIPAEEMVGRECREVFHCAECEPDCGLLAGVSEFPPPSNTALRLKTDNGRERLAVIRTRQVYSPSGEVAGAVVTIKDVTEESASQKREVIAESPQMREVIWLSS